MWLPRAVPARYRLRKGLRAAYATLQGSWCVTTTAGGDQVRRFDTEAFFRYAALPAALQGRLS